jgi:hypothetical protein
MHSRSPWPGHRCAKVIEWERRVGAQTLQLSPVVPVPTIFGDYLSVQNLSARRSMQWWRVRSRSMSSSIGCAGAIVALARRLQTPSSKGPPSTTCQHSRHAFACASTRTPACTGSPTKGGGHSVLGTPRLAAFQVDAETRPNGTAAAEFTDIHYVTDRQIDARH